MKIVKGNYIHFTEFLVCKMVWDWPLFLYLLCSLLRSPGTAEPAVPLPKAHRLQCTAPTAARTQSLRKMTLRIGEIVPLGGEQRFSSEVAEVGLI